MQNKLKTLNPIKFANFLEIKRNLIFCKGDLTNASNVRYYEVPLYYQQPLGPKWALDTQYLAAELIYS